MNTREFKWSPTEKKIARAVFDSAFKIEMANLKSDLVKKISKDISNEDVWKLEYFLTQKRKEIDIKFDYRYSQLLRVFGILLAEGTISLNDLSELSGEKIEVIKSFSDM